MEHVGGLRRDVRDPEQEGQRVRGGVEQDGPVRPSHAEQLDLRGHRERDHAVEGVHVSVVPVRHVARPGLADLDRADRTVVVEVRRPAGQHLEPRREADRGPVGIRHGDVPAPHQGAGQVEGDREGRAAGADRLHRAVDVGLARHRQGGRGPVLEPPSTEGEGGLAGVPRGRRGHLRDEHARVGDEARVGGRGVGARDDLLVLGHPHARGVDEHVVPGVGQRPFELRVLRDARVRPKRARRVVVGVQRLVGGDGEVLPVARIHRDDVPLGVEGPQLGAAGGEVGDPLRIDGEARDGDESRFVREGRDLVQALVQPIDVVPVVDGEEPEGVHGHAVPAETRGRHRREDDEVRIQLHQHGCEADVREAAGEVHVDVAGRVQGEGARGVGFHDPDVGEARACQKVALLVEDGDPRLAVPGAGDVGHVDPPVGADREAHVVVARV